MMEEGGDMRRWDELIPDVLGLIFRNLCLQEILTVIPTVCQSWRKAVSGPYCWQEIDIDDWSKRFQPDHVDRMLHLLISRSSGSLRKLTVSGLRTPSIFFFIANQAGPLQTLRLPRSNICDSIVEEIVGRLSSINFLDLSYCMKINAHSLEMIGKNCKYLVGLCRNLHPLDTDGKPAKDDEAYAIAATMPKLKHLEMAYHLITTGSVLKILLSCVELELFDLRGCWEVKLDEKFIREEHPRLKILGPLVRDYYESNNWDDCSDSSDYSYASDDLTWEYVNGYDAGDYYYDGTWDDQRRLEGLELRFYEGNDDEAWAYGWPPSP